MTLFHFDRNNDDRLNPTVDSMDVQPNPMAHATSSINPRAAGTQGAGKVITKDSRIVANNGSNNVGLFGFDDAGNMVVKVAKPGFDASSATNDQLNFNSLQNNLKIVSSGTLTLIANATAGVPIGVSINHGLGYVPAYLVYLVGFAGTSGQYLQLPNSTGLSVTGGQVSFNNWSYASADGTTFGVTFYSGSTINWGTFTYKYFLLQESVSS